jgi:type IV secretory pathway protease TraF
MKFHPGKEFAVVPAAVVLLLLPAMIKKPVFFINLSLSLPRGIYMRAQGTIQNGDFVIINTGALAFDNGLDNTHILKTVAYAHRGHVFIDDYFLIVNGTRIKKFRAAGVHYNAPLRDGEAVILGRHERSFDSRYFGPVSLRDCTRVVPLFLPGSL